MRGAELRHLRYFVAIAEELDITKAAARLNVSQPPLSRQIRDLEDELGVVLLERSPKEIRLTPAGKILFTEARKLLRHTAEAIRKVRAVPQASSLKLRVGYAPSPTAEILPAPCLLSKGLRRGRKWNCLISPRRNFSQAC